MQDLELLLLTASKKDYDSVENYADRLEDIISEANAALNAGTPIMPDSIYDTLYDSLQEVRPTSYLLQSVWSEDGEPEVEDADYNRLRQEYPLLSIETVKNCSAKGYSRFRELIEVSSTLEGESRANNICCSLKENGHGISVLYSNGKRIKAHTRGRASNGKDITEAVKFCTPAYIDAFRNKPLVDVRGELLVSFSNFEKAKDINGGLKSPFSAVASLSRASASEDEYKLLSFVAYTFVCEEADGSITVNQLKGSNTVAKEGTFGALFECLWELGFEVPPHFTTVLHADSYDEDIEYILDKMGTLTEGYEYYADGVVVSLDTLEDFNGVGTEGKVRLGSIALKMGIWQQDLYISTIKRVEWRPGKTKLTPVAVVEPTLTASGNTVQNVPLFAPCYVLSLEAFPGNVICFRFGGEAGVVPCYPDGRSVTDKTIG